jgi:predicted transcriptional regulator
MKVMKLGIMSRKDFRQYTIGIAKGKLKPDSDAPKVWFDSVESMAQVLSASNRELLALIRQHNPQSLRELSELSGRKKESLSRTLRTMDNYGIVRLEQGKRRATIPHVLADSFEVAAFH